MKSCFLENTIPAPMSHSIGPAYTKCQERSSNGFKDLATSMILNGVSHAFGEL